MSDPLVTPDDLALALNDAAINEPRAQMFIDDATLWCLTIIDPLPPIAVVVIKRIAGVAYTTTMSAARAQQLADAGSPMRGGGSGIRPTAQDRADLLRGSGNGGGFSINLLDGYDGPVLPPWDTNTTIDSISTS